MELAMKPSLLRPANAMTGIVILIVAAMVLYANWQDAHSMPSTPALPAGSPGGTSTSRADLERTIAEMDKRLASNPADAPGAVALADTLMRQARVVNDGSLARKAEVVLKGVLREAPQDYEAQRMLGTVYLSQHRFRDAIDAASRAQAMRPADAWNYAVMGDGQLELGEYDEAFESFQKMMELRPSAAAYARAAYSFELRGDLPRALKTMMMAAEATSAHDPEAQAWHYAQLGHLHFQMGNLRAARREYERAAFTFPDHPYALGGMAKVKAAEGDYLGALEIFEKLLATVPTPELAAQVGDLQRLLGKKEEAERHFILAERLEREGWKNEEPQPAALARLLAERDRKIGEAVALAEQAAANRRDIATEDALAWAYFKAGRIPEALAASKRAQRTGTRDPRVLYHAAAINQASGDLSEARRLVDEALARNPRFDPLAGPAAAALQASLGHAP
jgi:tetratricopeptide (TPR) repeat protein